MYSCSRHDAEDPAQDKTDFTGNPKQGTLRI